MFRRSSLTVVGFHVLGNRRLQLLRRGTDPGVERHDDGFLCLEHVPPASNAHEYKTQST